MKKWIAVAVGLLLAVGWARASGVYQLTVQEQARWDANWVVEFDYSDFTESTTNTAQTFTNVFYVPANYIISCAGAELIKAFDTANTSYTGSVTLEVGDGTDTDLFLTSMQLASDGTEVWIKNGRSDQALSTTSVTRTNVTGVSRLATTLTYAKTNAPAIAMTLGTVNLTYAKTNAPSITVTKQTEAIAYAKTNNPSISVSITTSTNTIHGTNYVWVSGVSVSATLTKGAVTVMTNATAAGTLTAGTLASVVTNATAAGTLTAGTLSVATNVSVTSAAQASLTAATLTDAAYGTKLYTSADFVDFKFTPNAQEALDDNSAGKVKIYLRMSPAVD